MLVICLSVYGQELRRVYSLSARIGVRAIRQAPVNDRRERQTARAGQIASRPSSNRFEP